MKVVYTEEKKKIPHNKFLVPTLLTPLENNPRVATVSGPGSALLWKILEYSVQKEL